MKNEPGRQHGRERALRPDNWETGTAKRQEEETDDGSSRAGPDLLCKGHDLTLGLEERTGMENNMVGRKAQAGRPIKKSWPPSRREAKED